MVLFSNNPLHLLNLLIQNLVLCIHLHDHSLIRYIKTNFYIRWYQTVMTLYLWFRCFTLKLWVFQLFIFHARPSKLCYWRFVWSLHFGFSCSCCLVSLLFSYRSIDPLLWEHRGLLFITTPYFLNCFRLHFDLDLTLLHSTYFLRHSNFYLSRSDWHFPVIYCLHSSY